MKKEDSREIGYYWLYFNDEWVIAEWNDGWWISGYIAFGDDDKRITEIDERRIERQETKELQTKMFQSSTYDDFVYVYEWEQ